MVIRRIKNWNDNIEKNWSEALLSQQFQYQLLFTIFFFIASAVVSVYFIDRCELRNGNILHDIILDALPRKDVSTYIFVLTYGGIIAAIISSIKYPKVLVKGFQMYAMLLLMRALFIMLFPLNPPHEMVMMQDKIGEFLLNKKDTPITKDLFFSGHTSTLFLMFFIVRNRFLKKSLLVICFIVPILLLIQHVHYTIDIVAAPFFAYAIYSLTNLFHQKLNTSLS